MAPWTQSTMTTKKTMRWNNSIGVVVAGTGAVADVDDCLALVMVVVGTVSPHRSFLWYWAPCDDYANIDGYGVAGHRGNYPIWETLHVHHLATASRNGFGSTKKITTTTLGNNQQKTSHLAYLHDSVWATPLCVAQDSI